MSRVVNVEYNIIKVFTIYILLIVILVSILFSARSRYLPSDVILFTEYDPSVDMDEKLARTSTLQEAQRLLCSGDEAAPPSKAQCPDSPLVSPPSTPPSPQYESASCSVAQEYDDIPLRQLPAGFVIHGNLQLLFILSYYYLFLYRGRLSKI